MADFFTGCETCETNARVYGVMTAEAKVAELEEEILAIKSRLTEFERPTATVPTSAQLKQYKEICDHGLCEDCRYGLCPLPDLVQKKSSGVK